MTGTILVAPFAQAQAYCTWKNARLPTFAEWQRAVRGAQGRIYPDGVSSNAEPNCGTGRAVGSGCMHRSSEGVYYETGVSPNSEWTSDVACDLAAAAPDGPLAATIAANQLNLYLVGQSTARIRCARTAKK